MRRPPPNLHLTVPALLAHHHHTRATELRPFNKGDVRISPEVSRRGSITFDDIGGEWEWEGTRGGLEEGLEGHLLGVVDSSVAVAAC